VIEDGEHRGERNQVSALDAEDEEPEEDGKPLSDLLVRDLTAHRTLGLRLALGDQPDIALLAVTHALAAQTPTTTVPLGICLNESGLPAAPTTASQKRGIRWVTSIMGATG
jgi:hypothetical protein